MNDGQAGLPPQPAANDVSEAINQSQEGSSTTAAPSDAAVMEAAQRQPQTSLAAPAMDSEGGLTAQTTLPFSNGFLQTMSADEVALYDRQIRLWGKQAQEKIRTARVLLIGLKGLGGEVAKNLVLAGIGSLTILDDQHVVPEDVGAQFLVSDEDVGKYRVEAALPRLQALNPRVKIKIDVKSIVFLAVTPTYLQQFDIVIATDQTGDMLQPLNAACRLVQRPLYASCTFGLFGFVFADLGAHKFVIERAKSNMVTRLGLESPTRSIIDVQTKKADSGKTIELVTKLEQYSPLSQVANAPLPVDRVSTRRRKLQVSPILACIRALWRFQLQTARAFPEGNREDLALYTTLAGNEHKNLLGLPHETLKSEVLRQFLQGVNTEISPTTAMLGGVVAQDVINVIGQNEQPIQNLMVWDGEEMTGEVYAMHAPPEILTPVATMPIQTLPVQTAATMNGNGGMMQAGMP